MSEELSPFWENVEKIIQHKNNVIRTGGEYPFSNAEDSAIARYAIAICEYLKHVGAEKIGKGQFESLESTIAPFRNALDNALSFRKTPNSGNRATNRQQAADRIKSTAVALVDAAQSVTTALMVQPLLQLKKIEEQVEDSQRAHQRISAASEHLRKTQSEANRILAEVRDYAARETATKFGRHFDELVEQHQRKANGWFVATILTAIGMAAVLLYLLFHPSQVSQETLTNPLLLQIIAIRFVLVSLLYLAVIWCMRNYRTHCHLVSVNQHRCKSLEAFPIMLDAIGNQGEARAALMIEVCSALFGSNVTGFLGPDENMQSNPIGDIARGIIQNR